MAIAAFALGSCCPTAEQPTTLNVENSLTAEEIANHPVLKGESGVPRILLRERGEARVNTGRALFAYPLAGICWVVPDAPVTVASHILDLPIWVLDWIL